MITLKHNTDCRMQIREYPLGAYKSWQGCVKWRGRMLWDERWCFNHVSCRVEAHARFVRCWKLAPSTTEAFIALAPKAFEGREVYLHELEKAVSLALSGPAPIVLPAQRELTINIDRTRRLL